jgi:biopolymer transport protein ExbB
MKKYVQSAFFLGLFLLPTIAEAATKAGGKKQTVLDVYREGGMAMHLILAFSIATVWLIIDMWLRTNQPKMSPPSDVQTARQTFMAGDYVGAYQAMKTSPSPFAQVVRAALASVGFGKDATEEALMAEVDKINSTLQTRINYLSVIGVCTPMVGLLGTVAGMKGAFGSLGTSHRPAHGTVELRVFRDLFGLQSSAQTLHSAKMSTWSGTSTVPSRKSPAPRGRVPGVCRNNK